MNWTDPQWISAMATSAAAIFAAIAAFAAWKSSNKQAELVAVDVRPVLGLTEALIGLSENCYPINLYFTNYGKGAAWIRKVEVKEGDKPIETNIGVPLCVGPGTISNIQIMLPEQNKKYNLTVSLYYWDVNDSAHCTTLNGYFGWLRPQVNPIALWELNSEDIHHNINDVPKPPQVANQPGSKKLS